MNLCRRLLVRVAAVMVLAPALSDEAGAACAVPMPTTIDWIVPYSPGGGYDVISRLIEPRLEAALGADIAIVNRPGAGGAVGAWAVGRAAPDGRTIGIINGPGLLLAHVIGGGGDMPDPAGDFTILGRVAVSEYVLVGAGGSAITTVEDLLRPAPTGPLVGAITDISGGNFVMTALSAYLLGFDVAFVPGYPGTRELALALLRGEADVTAFTFHSVLDHIASGDVHALLQLTDRPIADHPALAGVPLLGGPDGVAAARGRALGRDPAETEALVEAMLGIFTGGRLVVGPPGLDPAIAACLRGALQETLADPGLQAVADSAQLELAYGPPDEVLRRMRATVAAAATIRPILELHMARVRGDDAPAPSGAGTRP